MRLKTTVDLDGLFRNLDTLAEDVRTKAVPRALNTLLRQADVAGRRKIRDVYGIASSDLAPYYSLEFAGQGSTEAAIVAKGKGFPLRVFRPRRVKGGIAVTIKGRTVVFPHAFRPKAGLDTTQVFARGRYGAGSAAAARRRRGRRKKGLGSSSVGGSVFRPSGERMGRFAFGLGRFPITLLRSASAPDALLNPDVLAAMQDRIDEQYGKVLQREINAVKRGF